LKQKAVQKHAPDLWSQRANSVTMRKFVTEVADTEKLLLFGETGSGKTHFYLNILEWQEKQGLKRDDLKMSIIFPDRPTGLAKLVNLIPKRYIDRIDVYQVNDYEETVVATATAEETMEEHYKETGQFGWMVFELMENYWTFSQDYYCRQAYGTSMGEYFAQMQSLNAKSDKKTAYEAFAGPFGGPWPIIKFFHNFNWIDRVKRFPYNTIFTSEIKEEDNKDSIFYSLGYRPAGEKHNQHRMDTILYMGHKGNKFTMQPFKLTGYTRMYGEVNITGKNGYEEHRNAMKRLANLGYCVSKMDDLEQQAGINPPKRKKETEEKPKEEPKEKPKEVPEDESSDDDLFDV